jgi:hypothetical protein
MASRKIFRDLFYSLNPYVRLELGSYFIKESSEDHGFCEVSTHVPQEHCLPGYYSPDVDLYDHYTVIKDEKKFFDFMYQKLPAAYLPLEDLGPYLHICTDIPKGIIHNRALSMKRCYLEVSRYIASERLELGV